MLPATTRRVSVNAAPEINLRIRREAQERVNYFAAHPHAILGRLRELDQEWDIERTLEANAATLAFIGVALAATTNRRWLALPAVVTAFLLQHALQGWCPPVPILRRLGFRTASEIEQERNALKALRGDFGTINEGRDKAGAAMRAARA